MEESKTSAVLTSPIKKEATKLEKLLNQKDIFSFLRKVNKGEVRAFDELSDPVVASLSATTTENSGGSAVKMGKGQTDLQLRKAG
jgi:hypothetical protein